MIPDKISEECGIFGVFNTKSDMSCARAVYYGLFALQHRGQESCGIAASDKGTISYHKDMGLVGEVFSDDKIDALKGDMAIGHVRYSTTGGSFRENAQPLVIRYIKGPLTIAHNGNLTNTAELRKELEREGAIFQTSADSEIIAYLIARERSDSSNVQTAILKAMKKLKGAYSLLVMSPKKIIAIRDPLGFRPLCYGKLSGGYVFASESCALDAVGAKFVRDLEPGEIVYADKNGIYSIKDNCSGEMRRCIFEYIYFARPDSVIDGVSVYKSRTKAGKLLYEQDPTDADLVIGVPDSGLDAAIGYADASGIPFCRGLVKNNYVGRTFIQPEQAKRQNSVSIKLNALSEAVKDKDIVMIDDSIVRGTTMAKLVDMLRAAGAKKVHVRISSPPFLWPCFYGTDIPSRDQLCASTRSIDEIRMDIGADSLGFLDTKNLREIIGQHGEDKTFCDACFTGDYPEPVYGGENV